MLKYLKSYVTDFEKELNIDLLHKTADEPLVEFIKDSFRSLEVFNNIKILGFDYNDTESEIDDDKYVLKRDKKKKNLFKNKYINDNRCGLLTVHIQITVDEVDSKTKRVQTIKKIKRKNLLIPICLNGRYRIKGTDYYSIIQLTDKSTYNTSDTVTLKTLMPVAIKRESLTVKSVDDPNDNDDRGMEFTVPVYNVYIFKNPYPVILFFFARGYTWAMNYLNINSIVDITDTLENADFNKNLYFQISSKCYVYVNKYIFINNTYVQGIIGMILKSTTNRFSVDDFYNEDTWYKKLGSQGKIEKGKGLLTSLKRLLDERSKKNLKLDKHDKEDIYSILRWQMMEYNTLRLKDNMSLDNKRFRENEQYAALFDLELSKRLKRILQLGSKAVMSNFEELFKFSNELLIQIMQTSGILVYDDNINDMDFFSRYKYSTKGPHSMGGKNEKRIPTKYRDIHPSYIGYIDLMVCGNSDPGTSGLLSPFSNIKSMYFNDDREPNDNYYELYTQVSELLDSEDEHVIRIHADNKEDYYQVLDKITDFYKDGINIYGIPKNNDIVIENDKNDDK